MLVGWGSYFKFKNIWWRDSSLLDNLESWWKESDIFKGSISYCFVKQILILKNKISIWNKEVFKNIFEEKKVIESKLEDLNEKVIKEGMFKDDFLKEKDLKSKELEILSREEIFSRNKAREH